METSFIIGREKLRAQLHQSAFRRWRNRLFIVLNNLALDATEFFRIRPTASSNWAPDRDLKSRTASVPPHLWRARRPRSYPG